MTPRPQVGNPLPRLFRVPTDEAVINRMGFNNDGATAVARRLKLSPGRTPIGVNLGKNAETPLEQALDDYRACLEELFDVGSYVVVNVSSPNTPGLRALQIHCQPASCCLAAYRTVIKPWHERDRCGRVRCS